MPATAPIPTLLRRLLSLGAGVGLVAAGLTAMVAPAATAAPAAHPTAKVKCVSVKTGFARYSTGRSCRKGERRDAKPCAKGGSCVVGDIGPGRGKVFYAARTKQPWGRYLEAAPGTWAGPAGDPNLNWCQDVTTSVPGTAATGLGAGAANTTAMLGACSAEAAVAAHGYRGGGRTDWYLPAKDELRELFLHRDLVGGFIQHGYWSSSESEPSFAWIQDFYPDYAPAPCDKSFANYVRPIRAF
jgi:hypothetical protein